MPNNVDINEMLLDAVITGDYGRNNMHRYLTSEGNCSAAFLISEITYDLKSSVRASGRRSDVLPELLNAVIKAVDWNAFAADFNRHFKKEIESDYLKYKKD